MSLDSAERQALREIRRNNGVDAALVEEASRNADVLSALTSLKGKLQKSLQILSDELYSKPAHFVLEMLQNADDNSYSPSVTPEIQILLRPSYMQLQCNETGFTAANVEAFCGIGQSTKKNQTGYIGEKGIGAKSMFKVANKVHVHSLGYHFVLDRAGELGMISPEWTPPSPDQTSGWTLLRLDFCDDKQYPAVKSQLRQVRDSVLLFMRRLARLTVDDGDTFSVQRHLTGDTVSVERDLKGEFVTIVTESGGSTTRQQFFCVTKPIDAYRGEPKRAAVEKTKIVLAFPLDASREPIAARDQMVHAFLPMRSVGFKFIVQADFLTAANREDILSDLKWNTTLQRGVLETFCSALLLFRFVPTLETGWLHFLPNPSDVVGSFFVRIARDIVARIRGNETIMDATRKYRRPLDIKFPSSFSSSDRCGLIPASYLPFRYVSDAYPNGVKSKLILLGVTDMTFDDFVSGLSAMGSAITREKSEWIEQVCSLLCDHGFTWRWRAYQLNDARIRNLPLARLVDGSWVECGTCETLFFNPDSSSFPPGLGMNVLESDSSAMMRKQLLERLGVRDIDSQLVIEKICVVHGSPSRIMAGHALQHVLYVFEKSRIIQVNLGANSLRLLDTSGSLACGGDLYMDDFEAHGTALSENLRHPARFLNASFVSPGGGLLARWRHPEWRRWLKTTFGVATVPRVSSGRPTKEFSDLVDRLRLSDCTRMLSLLRQFWPEISAQMSRPQEVVALNAYLSEIEVRCRNGEVAKLASTYVLTRALARFASPDVPQLPVADPDSDWSFLHNFGVSTEVDARFFLKRLLALAHSPDATLNDVFDLYQQLDARFHELSDEIRDAFNTQDLFFVDHTWHPRKDIVWTGPAVMTLKAALAPNYYALAKLFRDQLKIPDAPCTIIADELRSFSGAIAGRALDEEEQKTLFALLRHADKTIFESGTDAAKDWAKELHSVAIFPVRRPTVDMVTLATPDDRSLSTADPTGYFSAMFAGSLSFVALSAGKLESIRNLLAHLGLDGRRVDRLVASTVLLDGVLLENGADVGLLAKREIAEYMSKLPFIARVQHRRSGKPSLKSISVCKVDTIVVTYTLPVDVPDVKPISAPATCWAYMDSSGRLTLYIAATSSSTNRFSAAVDAMTRALGLMDIDYMTLTTILHFDDTDEIDAMLTRSGFPPLEADSHRLNGREVGARSRPIGVDAAAMQSGTRRTSTRAETGDAGSSTEPVASPAPAPTAPALAAARNAIDAYAQSIDGREEIDHVKAAAVRTSLPSAARLDSPGAAVIHLPEPTPPPISTDAALSHEDESVGLSGIIMRVMRRGGLRGASMEDERAREIGFLGEQFVYELLRHHLKDCPTPFTYENWTSSLRSLAGFPAFVGDEVTDFTYHDTDGTLTRHMFPSDHECSERSPKYFIEVKSTSGDQSNHFFMRRRQFLEAFRMSRSRQDKDAPRQLYVLFRVSSIGGHGTPILQIYADPHDMLSRGTLRIESDSVQVRIVGE